MKKKTNHPDPLEMERFFRELELQKDSLDRSLEDSEYLNPWNLGKKKIQGKTFICAKLPDKLPTKE